VGRLEVSFDAMDLPADPGLTLTVYTAEPGSSSEDGLRLLASWAATVANTVDLAVDNDHTSTSTKDQ
jgi:hypothetical protein